MVSIFKVLLFWPFLQLGVESGNSIWSPVGLTIWETAVCLMLYHHSETWQMMQNKPLRIIEDLFNSFSCSFFQIGAGAPIANFYWQTGTLLPKNSILQRRLSFYHNLANLPPHSLPSEVFHIQERKNLPGIGRTLTQLRDPTPRCWYQKRYRNGAWGSL